MNQLKLLYHHFRSLQIGVVHCILKLKHHDTEMHIEIANKLFAKIDALLNNHVKHNASEIISKKELEEMSNFIQILHSLRHDDTNVQRSTSKLHELKKFRNYLDQISSLIRNYGDKLVDCQSTILKGYSESMNSL
jgi:hypothetical protein